MMESQPQQVKFSRGEVVVPNNNINAAFRYSGPSDLCDDVEYRHPTDKELSYYLLNVETDELVEYKNEKMFSKQYDDRVKGARKSRSSEVGHYRSMEYGFKIFGKK